MRTFGVVQSFVCEKDDLRVFLLLSLLQRLRVLEVKQRFSVLPVPDPALAQ
jgi:hypothetical protein